MDLQSISSFQETHAVDIQDSYTPNYSSSIDENLPYCCFFVRCFHWVLMPLLLLIKVILKFFYRLIKAIFLCIWWNILCIILILAIVFIIWFVGTLSAVTFPFVLASWLVLRFSQVFKRGEDYDKVSQVKRLVEWYMFINSVLLVFAFGQFCTNSKDIGLEHVTILGKALLHWGDIIFYKIISLFGIRFILFWIILHFMPRMTLEHNESGLRVVQTTCDIVDCLLLLRSVFLIFNSLPQHEFLGLLIRKWFEVPIFIVIGWNVIALSTHFIVWSIHKLLSWYLDRVHDDSERSHRYLLLERLLSVQCLVYYGNGTKRSFNLMLSSLLCLLVWVFYFSPHLTKTEDSRAKTVKDFGTWTSTILLILSFFWVLKDFVLLSWEANAVYHRLSHRIKDARKLFYFLGLLDRHRNDILKVRYAVVDRISLENRAQIFFAKYLSRVDTYYQDKMDEDEDDNEEMQPREPVDGTITEGDSSQVKCNNEEMAPREPVDGTITEGDSSQVKCNNEEMEPREPVDGTITEGDSSQVNEEMEPRKPVHGTITKGDSSQVKCKLSRKKRARVKRDLLLPKDETMTLFIIQQVAQYFVTAADALYKINTSDIVRKLKPDSDNREILKNLIVGKNNASDVDRNSQESVEQDWNYLESLLKLDPCTYVSRDTVKTWLEKSYNECLFLANTLRSAKEVVECLNNIISVLLICASLILWLFFTGLADKKSLLLIASPLLAATFVFGDSCKVLFQGIIFVYVVHPFDVGDLCVVDGIMLEVKSVGVWKTTFSNFDKVGTREEAIYPNSELAKKMIINHKTEFDWNDCVEFDVAHLDKQRLEELKTQIKHCLEDRKDGSKHCLLNVAVLSSIREPKIVVRFRHNKHHEGITNYECAKVKDDLRTALILDVQDLVNKQDSN